METRPLPQTFWGPAVPDKTPDDQVPKIQPAPTEFEEWEASFADLGTSLQQAMSQNFGAHSTLINKTMMTIDDVYQHLVALRDFHSMPEPVTNPLENFNAAHYAASIEEPKRGPGRPAKSAPPTVVEDPDEAIRKHVAKQAKAEKLERVNAAKLAWRTAIEQRRKVVADWDAWVGHLRQAVWDAERS